MSFISEQRTLLRSLAVGGALLGALATAGSAAAALGGGPAAQFTDRPNLQTVTFDGDIGAFTFDVGVDPGPEGLDADDFAIGGYRSGITNDEDTPGVVVIDTLNPDTVLVEYDQDTDDVDFNAATFGAVEAGSVQGDGTFSEGNFYDATGLTGSGSENGTRGHTAGPDLQSVAIISGLNRIVYTFDQEVTEDPVPDEDAFGYVDVNGVEFDGDGIDVNGNQVQIDFNAGDDVDDARQAFVDDDDSPDVRGAESQVEGPPSSNVGVPGKNPLTDAAGLVSAELQGSATLLFKFDQPIGNPDPGDFTAVLSNGVPIVAGGASVQGGDTVRATFDTSQFTEHIVYGSVENDAVDTAGEANNSLASGKPAGGNVGAKSSGFTTAPDAVSATFNAAIGQVSVVFDSRISVDPADLDETDFDLYSEDGVAITTNPNGAFVDQTTGPNRPRVVLQFDPEDVAVADFIQIEGQRVEDVASDIDWEDDFAVIGTIGDSGLVPRSGLDDQNVETFVVPTATTTVFTK